MISWSSMENDSKGYFTIAYWSANLKVTIPLTEETKSASTKASESWKYHFLAL